MDQKNKDLIVAVWMLTYNHENFIEQSIEGIINQNTDFKFKLFIGEDCSTDNTRVICIEFAKKFPEKISLYLNEKNDIKKNSETIYNACLHSGAKYVAMCEGDDYWSDPYKLQKQVDYISRNDECNLVFTDVRVWKQNENRFAANWATVKNEKYEFKDLVSRNVITTCTILFRNPGGEVIQNWLQHFKVADYALSLFLVRSGYAYFINEVTSVYRQHSNGIFSLKGASIFIDTHIDVLHALKGLSLSKRELVMVRKSLVKWYYAKVVRMSNDLRFSEIRTFIKKTLKPSDIFINLPYFLKILFLFCFPKSKSNVFAENPVK